MTRPLTLVTRSTPQHGPGLAARARARRNAELRRLAALSLSAMVTGAAAQLGRELVRRVTR